MFYEIHSKFGVSESTPLTAKQLHNLQNDAFLGQLCSASLRPLCWRIFLGCISLNGPVAWSKELNKMSADYVTLKKSVVPKVSSEVKIDPLSALIGEKNEEWDEYYKV
jgi:hypothetical protein